MFCRKKIKELEHKIEILKDVLNCYKGDRELFEWKHKQLRIAESLLTEEQRYEYYRLLSECDPENTAV